MSAGFVEVGVKIIQARHLRIEANFNTCIEVHVGGKSKVTRAAKFSDSPFFNEYFVFEFQDDDFEKFLEHSIEFHVKSWKGLFSRSHTVAEFSVSLNDVYKRPSHQIFRQWAQLNHPRSLSAGPQGFVKCDIRILKSGEIVDQPSQLGLQDEDIIEENLIHQTEGQRGAIRRVAEYLISVHCADDLPKIGKKEINSQVTICISDLKGTTTVVKHSRSPSWNETLTITDFYPPVWSRIRIHLLCCSKLGSKILAEHCIPVEHISSFDDANEFGPTFGPAFIHMYSEAGVYMGRILLSIHTNVLPDGPRDKSEIRRVSVKKSDEASKIEVPSSNMVLFCSVLDVTLQGAKLDKKKFRVEVGLTPPKCADKSDVTSSLGCIKGDECFYSLDISHTVPCLSTTANWPDRRFSAFLSNQLYAIVNSMARLPSSEVGMAVGLQKTLTAIEGFLKQLKNRGNEEGFTELDFHRQITLEEKLALAGQEIARILKFDKIEMADLHCVVGELRSLTIDPQQYGVPNVSVRLLSADGQLIGDNVIPIEKIICCSFNPNGAGQISSKPATVFLQNRASKKDKGNWNLISKAKLRLLLWFGLPSEVPQLLRTLPNASNLTDRLPMLMKFTEKVVYECQVQLYHGTVSAGWSASTLANPFIRISIGSRSVSSEVKRETLAPEWNQAMALGPIVVWGATSTDSPPTIDLELFDFGIGRPAEYIGRCSIAAPICTSAPAEVNPKWYTVRRGMKTTANILASFQMKLKPDEEEKCCIPEHVPLEMSEYRVGCLAWALLSEHKLDSPKITIEIGGQKIGSASLVHFSRYANFRQPPTSVLLSLPSNPKFLPPIVIKLFCQKSSVEFEAICVVNETKTFLQEEHKLYEVSLNDGPIVILADLNKIKAPVGEMIEPKKSIPANEPESVSDQESDSADTPLLRTYRRASIAVTKVPDFLLTTYTKLKSIYTARTNLDPNLNKSTEETLELDWWSKFYASERKAGAENSDHLITLQLYNGELEEQPEFRKFSDVAQSFPLVAGLRKKEEEPSQRATFVGNFTFSPASNAFVPAPNAKASMCMIARVYVVRGLRLCPKDKNGLSDPYITISNDSRVLLKDRDNFIPETLDPIFGRCFELMLCFPEDHSIRIGVFDRNEAASDDFIGETEIDLERRLMTRHRANCGISRSYSLKGYNTWRDAETPLEILQQLCSDHNITPLEFDSESNLRVGNFLIKNAPGLSQEQLALEALKNWHRIGGWELVPEHVESRPLFHPKKPGIEQGRLQIWIDLFPTFGPLPGPKVNIAPRAPEEYELRVVVWMAEEIPLYDTNLSGTKMSDIYFRGWLGENGKTQCTDIHHRSLTGEGLFNWRFVFPFKYLHTERCLLVEHTGFASLFTKGQQLVPCTFNIQAWDADIITSDDFLSCTSLDLFQMPRGAKTSALCNRNSKSDEFVNLFLAKKCRGWWQLHNCKGEPAGKAELEFELLTKIEAEENPAGKGRAPPNELHPPKRPDTSFLWLLNPVRAARVVLWRSYGRKIVLYLAVGLVVAGLAYAVLSIPTVVIQGFIQKVIGR